MTVLYSWENKEIGMTINGSEGYRSILGRLGNDYSMYLVTQ